MNPHHDIQDELDSRLDALLAARCVAPRPDFEAAVLRNIENGTGDTLDAAIDNRLAFHPLRARPERVERIFRHVTGVIRFRRFLAWTAPAMAAMVAGLLALPVFINQEQHLSAELLVSQAMERDPALAAMLGTDAADEGMLLDRETVRAMSGLNENTLAWLELLTSNDR